MKNNIKKMNRSELKERLNIGDIVLVRHRGDGFVSESIKWFTSSQYSHAMIYDGDGRFIEYGWDGCVSTPLKYYLDNKFDLAVMKVPDISYFKKQKIVATAEQEAKDNISYDFKSMLGNVIVELLFKVGVNIRRYPNFYNNPGFKCSSGVAWWYYKGAGIELCPDIDVENISPANIFNSRKTLIKFFCKRMGT